jgi:hypothetical protein
MKSALVLSLAGLAIAAPAPLASRSLFGDVMSSLSNLGHDLQNATFAGLASTIAQSVENPGLTGGMYTASSLHYEQDFY